MRSETFDKLDRQYPRKGNFKDLSGSVINGVKIIRYVGTHKCCIYYECECQCGNKFISASHNIKRGKSRSCGCVQKVRRNKRSFINSALPLSNVKLYRIHQDLVQSQMGNVCEDWIDANVGFTNFYNWAINSGYEEGMNILRRCTDIPYSPDNCILVDSKLSRRFHSNCRYFTVGEYTFPVGIWSDITGLSVSSIMGRIKNCNWSKEDAVLTPINGTPGVDIIDYIIPPEYEILNGCGQ